MDKENRQIEEQRLLELNSSLSFLNSSNTYNNYFKTMLERAILTNMNTSDAQDSPPRDLSFKKSFQASNSSPGTTSSLIPTRNGSQNTYNFDSPQVSFRVKSSSNGLEPAAILDHKGVKQRKEEAIRKAQEVAQAIEARKEAEQRIANRMRDKLIEQNKKSKYDEHEKRERHKGSIFDKRIVITL